MTRSKQLAVQSDDNLEKSIEDCTFSIGCPNSFGVSIKQEYFDRQSEKFKISTQSEFSMIQNEMYSPVWRGKVCSENNCKEISSYATLDSLRSWNLPKGDYVLETYAETPNDRLRWWLFYLGLSLSILPSFIKYLILKRRASV
jgi:hypothetical protein